MMPEGSGDVGVRQRSRTATTAQARRREGRSFRPRGIPRNRGGTAIFRRAGAAGALHREAK